MPSTLRNTQTDGFTPGYPGVRLTRRVNSPSRNIPAVSERQSENLFMSAERGFNPGLIQWGGVAAYTRGQYVYTYTYTSIYLSIYISMHQSINHSIHQSIHLYIYLSIYLYLPLSLYSCLLEHTSKQEHAGCVGKAERKDVMRACLLREGREPARDAPPPCLRLKRQHIIRLG